MSEDQPATSRPTRPRRRRGRKFLIALAVLLLASGVFRGVVAYRAHAAVAAYRAQGYPVTLEQLAELYPAVPQSQNGALLFDRAIEKIVKPDDAQAKLIPLIVGSEVNEVVLPWPSPVSEAVDRYLTANTEALGLIEEGATKPAFAYPLPLQIPPLDLVTQFTDRCAELRCCARLLELQQAAFLDAGNGPAAIDCIAQTRALARSLQSQPFDLAYMIRWSIHLITRVQTERALQYLQLDKQQLDQLAHVLSPADEDSLHVVLRSEVPWGLAAISLDRQVLWWQYGGSYPSVAIPSRAYWVWQTLSGLHDLDKIAYLTRMQEFIAAADLPFPDAWQRANEIERQAPSLPWFYELTRVNTQSFRTLFSMRDMGCVSRQLALTAIAIERYRLDHGQLPFALDAIVPQYADAVPTDPFDSQPLRYRVLGNGYLLYSVGWNGVDDGGEEKGMQGDVPFRVQRPAPTTAPSH